MNEQTKERRTTKRTKPPTVEEKKQAEAKQQKYITIRIPVGELTDGNGYQVSKRGYPRQFRARPLTPRQGQALAAVRLGMLAVGELLDAQTIGFVSRKREPKPVDAKEEVLCRILELIAAEIEEK